MESKKMRKTIFYIFICIISLYLMGCEKAPASDNENTKLPQYKDRS